jgi:hypothetical protein
MKVEVCKSQNGQTKGYTIVSILVMYGWPAGSLCTAGGAEVVTTNQVPRETEPRECPNLTQLQLEGWRIATSFLLQRMQPHKTGAVMQKEPVGEINPGFSGRTFFSKNTTTNRPFPAALCSSKQQHQQQPSGHHRQQVTNQSPVQSMHAKNVISITMEDTFTVITTMVQIIIELPGAMTK